MLDNLSYLTDLPDIDKQGTRRFQALLTKIAIDMKVTIVLLAHPNKAGDEYSGNVQWNNGFRNRLFLSRPKSEGHSDPDQRILSRSKSNNAAIGETIDLRWQDWAFVTDDASPSMWEGMPQNAADAADNDRFLALLDQATQEGRALSASAHAGNYAPKIMAQMPASRNMPRARLEHAMNRLFQLGTIKANQELWRDAKRMPVTGIKRMDDVPPGSAARLPYGSSNTPANEAQVVENTCRPVLPAGSAARLPYGSSNTPENEAQVVENTCRPVAARLPLGSAGLGWGEAPPKGGPSPHSNPDPFAIDPDDVEPM